jgi:hypothetical protein
VNTDAPPDRPPVTVFFFGKHYPTPEQQAAIMELYDRGLADCPGCRSWWGKHPGVDLPPLLDELTAYHEHGHREAP